MTIKGFIQLKQHIKFNVGQYLCGKINTPVKIREMIKDKARVNPCLEINEANETEFEEISDINTEIALPLDDEIETNHEYYSDEEIEEAYDALNDRRLLRKQDTLSIIEDLAIDPEKQKELLNELSRLASDEEVSNVLEQLSDRELPHIPDISPSVAIMYGEKAIETEVYELPGLEGLSLKDEYKNELPDDYKEAVELINFVEWHRIIMKKIADIIAERQEVFFKADDFQTACKSLKPFTQKELADTIKAKDIISKSTVSRLLKDNLVDTKFGLIPFKQFFPGKKSHRSKSQHTIAPKVIRQHIKEFLDSNSNATDNEIMVYLEKQGIDISPKMIQYHRKKLGIVRPRGRKKK